MSQRSVGVFVSSKMVELREERKALEALLPTLGDETAGIHPWIFESDAPASDSSIRSVYLKALDESGLYIGLFWNEYGEWTIDEFHHAGELGIPRHIYVKNVNSDQRDPRLNAFLNKQSDVRFGITPRWFTDVEDLKQQVTRSVQQWLIERQVAHHSVTTAVVAEIADDVPELPRHFVGREELIARVGALLEDNERVLLHGIGGMGKSALAATIAANHIDVGERIVIWVRAGAAEADAIFEAIGQAFGAQEAIVTTSGDARLQAVRHLLADKNALLVLDDTWNGQALARVVKALPRRMPLLVTSRLRFPLDEIINVGELEADEALKLLEYHARQRYLSQNTDAGSLCQVLGNHPFALEVAGKTLKVYDLAPADLLKRIEETPHDLSMPGDFGELGRKGIKSLLDTSVDALSKELHDVFVALGGLFESSATAELLALAVTDDVGHTMQCLQQLTLRGLVNERTYRQHTYFHLHDLAYSYARSLFKSKGMREEPVIEACLRYTQSYQDELEMLDIEQSNILEAAEAAHQAGQDNILIEIMRLLVVVGPYFAARGFTSLSLNLLQRAITAASGQDQPETAHYLLSKLGNAYADFMGDFDSALSAYQKALDLARQLENPHREAILLTVIGIVRFRQQAADADMYHQQAEKIAKTHEDDFALAQIIHNRGYQATFQAHPDYKLGRTLSDEAVEIASRQGLTAIHFWSLVNRGACEHELGHFEIALLTHREAYQLAQEHENYPWMAGALRSIGEDYDRLGERTEAQKAFDEALALWQQSGAKAMVDDLISYMQEKNYTIRVEAH